MSKLCGSDSWEAASLWRKVRSCFLADTRWDGALPAMRVVNARSLHHQQGWQLWTNPNQTSPRGPPR